MNQFLEWIRQIFSSWKFWIVVPPWDVGVRVRMGRNAVALQPGPHFRIPLIDEIMLVNTRLRVVSTPPITITNGGLHPRTLSAVIGYSIVDPLASVLRYDAPHMAVAAVAQSEVAKLQAADKCCDAIANHFQPDGIRIEFVRYTEDVEVQTLRVLQNSWGLDSGRGDGPIAAPGMQARY